MTSYKRCDSLPTREAIFIKRFYPIYYNVIPYLLGLNVGKTKKANSGLNFPKLMARQLHNEKGTFMVPFLLWHKSVITPDLLRAVHELPGSPGARRARALVEHTRKPGLRGRSLRRSPLGSRAPRGEDTSEPVPRPQPGGEWGRQVRDSSSLCSSLRFFGEKTLAWQAFGFARPTFLLRDNEIKKGGCHAEARMCGSGQTTMARYMP